MVNYPNYYQNYPNYQQQYQQPIQPMQPVAQPPVSIPKQVLDWVVSEDEGLNYPLNPGQSIFLMNQKEPYLYMKSIDQLGKPTFIKKRLVDETDNQESKVDLSGYIRREEIENIISNKIQKEIEKKISEMSFKPTKTKKTIVVDDED